MKPDLILLHGALGAGLQLTPLAGLLREDFTVHVLNFDGHGGKPLDAAFSIARFSDNVSDYIASHIVSPPFIFGYSMGGYVALDAISKGTEVRKLLTLGTKFSWTPESAVQEVKRLNPDVIAEKIPAFAAHLEKLHAPEDWKKVMNQTADLMLDLGQSPVLTDDVLRSIPMEVICLLGEDDTMVTLEETEHAVTTIPRAQLCILPGIPHPIERVPVDLLAEKIVQNFLK